MRLGSYACELLPGLARRRHLRRAPRSTSATATATSSTRHYESCLTQGGMAISGKTPDGKFVEIAEIPDHPWYVAVQFHPEFKSQAARAPSAVRGLRAGQPGEPRSARAREARRPLGVPVARSCEGGGPPPATLWRSLRGGGPPLPDRGALRDREPAPPGPGRGAPQGHHGRAGHPARLQGQLRQGQPLEPRLVPRPGARARPGDPGRRRERATACRSSPTSTRWRRSSGRPRWRTSCRSPPSSAGRPTSCWKRRAAAAS